MCDCCVLQSIQIVADRSEIAHVNVHVRLYEGAVKLQKKMETTASRANVRPEPALLLPQACCVGIIVCELCAAGAPFSVVDCWSVLAVAIVPCVHVVF